jgi:hypothetical protein
MKLELTIPTELKEITLGNYQRFMAVAETSNDEDFVAQKMIECFCNIDLNEAVKIPYKETVEMVNKFNEMFEKKPEFQPTFTLGGKEFGFIPDLENISLGELADLQNNIGDVQTYNKAMATLYRPIIQKSFGKYEIEEYNGTTYSEVMLHAPLDVAIGAVVFFCDLIKDLSNALATYLEREMRKMMNLAKGHNLTNDGDGTLASIHSLGETLQNLTIFPEFKLPKLSRY